MNTSALETTLALRFQLEQAPSICSQVNSHPAIAFTRLRSARPMRGRSLSVPREEAFAFQVPLTSAFFSEAWVAGKSSTVPRPSPGDVFLFDLSYNPRVALENPFDSVRCYIAQATLDGLAYERGLLRVGGLRAPSFGERDPVLYGLVRTLVAAMEQDGEGTALFADYLALAFHDHVMRTYGGAQATRGIRGGLTPRQIRRTLEFVEANLSGNPSIAALARESDLSSSYFARAFRETTGMAPHQWLTLRRVERAKQLLQETGTSLADIAQACGFVDQSHLSRAFSRREGRSPGAWRRLHPR